MRSQTDRSGCHANVETEMAREFREASTHDRVGPDSRRNTAQIGVRGLATPLAQRGDVDYSDLSARLESRADQIGDRFSEVVNGLCTVDPEGKHRDGVRWLDRGRDHRRRKDSGAERERHREIDSKSLRTACSGQRLPPAVAGIGEPEADRLWGNGAVRAPSLRPPGV